VCEISVRAMLRGRPSVVTGWRNALMAQSLRLTPRRLQAALAHAVMNSR
jgi:short-subunit dehydrogenase